MVVLLGGIAPGQAWFGIVLVLAYGIGMAAALTGVGLLLAQLRGRVDRRLLVPPRRCWPVPAGCCRSAPPR